MSDVEKVIKLLAEEYDRTFFLPREKSNDPYYVLISCILSQRTKDEVTYLAANRLFKLAKTPKQMLKLPLNKVERTIFPVGFYRTKAKRIKEVSKELLKKYDGAVPNQMEDLLKLKGVGRKTAGIVLTHAYNIPALPIDTHCHRIPNRLGWIKTKTPEETEIRLMKMVPKRYWLELNELLVKHGQQICKPISPFCSKCIIRKYCRRVGVNKSR